MPDKSIAAAAILGLLWLGEALVPMFEGREKRVSHGAANLLLGVLNALLSSFLFAGLVLLVTEWARVRPFGILHWIDAPAWVIWPAAILLFDCWQYAWHRLNHAVPLLWRLHSVHHNDGDLDATSGVRFHTFEILLSATVRMAVLPMIGMTIEQLLLYEAMALPVVLFHHSNVRVPRGVDRVLRVLIVTPWMHWVHHSRWQPETDSNFSSLFSWWDRLFRTFRLRDDPSTIELGLDGYEEPEWRSLSGMLLAPFRSRTVESGAGRGGSSGGSSGRASGGASGGARGGPGGPPSTGPG